MLKIFKSHIRLFIVILVLLVLSYFSGKLIVNLHKNTKNDLIDKHNTEKLTQIENILISYNALNNNKLLTAERVIDIVFKNNSLRINDTSFVYIDVSINKKLPTEKFRVNELLLKNENILSQSSVFDDITYSVNAFVALWQKVENGFVRVKSNEPANEIYTSGFLNDSSEIIIKIINGTKPVVREYNLNDSKLVKFIPLYIDGEVKAFLKIILNESISSVFQRFYIDNSEQLIIFNENGDILFQNSADINNELNFSELRKVEFLKSKMSKSRSFKNFIITYQYSPVLDFYIASVKTKDFIRSKTKSDIIKIWIFILISFIIILGIIIFSYIYVLKVRERIILNIKGIITDFYTTDNDISLDNVLYQLNSYNEDIIQYTKALNEGDLEKQFKFLSEKNKTTKELGKLQEKLKISLENEKKRKKEEELNDHLNKGRTEITELLRYLTDLNDLSFNILKNTAEFLNIQQGGMFILDNSDPDEPVMEMIASYAYDKKKFAAKRIPLNEGLIGRAYLERENIYMTEIPENYTLIESGFGSQEPKSLLIVPLVFNNDVQAVMELASLYEIEEYKVRFIESIGESIASTISNLKQTKQTQELLLQTRSQSKEIEEQRKTLEEKINTHRKQNRNLDKEILQLIEIIESIKSITYMVEYDLEGHIMDVSRKTLDVLEAKKGDMISKHHRAFIEDENYDESYKNFWIELSENKTQHRIEKVKFRGKEVSLSQSYVPIRNTRRKIYRILSIGSIIN